MKLLFKNVWLADGTGSGLKRSAVLTGNGRIVAVESDISASAADQMIDGRKLILAPGFIDTHSHSDLSILARPEGWSKVSQGVTSEIVGNCGLSAFPLTADNREHLQTLYRQYGVALDWSDFATYQARLRQAAKLKIHSLAGHNTLRAAVAGYEKKELSPQELIRMEALLDDELTAGALGLSLGLLYVPGKFADLDEVTRLMATVARHGKIVAVHLRSEGDMLTESVREMIKCANAAKLGKLHISHFKTAGKANFYQLDIVLDLIAEAKASGLEITCDRYPYIESMTQLSVILPGKYDNLSDVKIQAALQDPETRLTVAAMLNKERARDYWQNVILSSAPGKYQKYCGQTLSDIAKALALDPALLTVEMLSQNAPGTMAAFRGMSPKNMDTILKLDFCMCGSDENARPADESIGRSHPRGFGAFPKFVRHLLDQNREISKVVQKVTQLPAKTFDLPQQGEVKPGFPADLTLFDPDLINSRADFTNPHTPADGIRLVAIDGDIVYQN